MRTFSRKILSGCLAIAFAITMAATPAVAVAATDTFSIATTRLGGIDRLETAAKVAQAGWTASDYAVLSAASDANLVDALTAAPLAKLKNAPILLTQGNELSAYAENELTRLGVKTVYVTSGTAVIKQPVLDKLASMGITVVPLGGSDRFETAVNIAKQFDNPQKVVVATAWSNADALSISSIAAAHGMPILLTNAASVPGNVKSYIDGLSKLTHTYVVGGTAVISDNVLKALPKAERIAGANRYATNLEILKKFYGSIKPGKVFVANGQNSHLVDSLAGAPYAALTASPLLLTESSMPAASKEFARKYLLPNKLVALGGEAAVPTSILSGLINFTTYADDNATYGSSSAAQPESLKDALRISGNNVTVNNLAADYSVYITGDNAKLNNVTVKGSLFIDPGANGSAYLDKVKADKIVVLSGGKDSIHISQSASGELVVVSRDDQGTPSTVRVVAENGTTIGNTTVATYAIIDAATGAVVGTVTISSVAGETPQVELKGNFTEPVVIDGPANVSLAAGTVVASMERLAEDGSLNVPAGASIGSFSGNTSGVSGQGTIGDKTADQVGTPTTPSGSGGGGGGGPIAPAFTAFSTGVDNSQLASRKIAFQSSNGSYAHLSNASITVNRAPVVMTLKQGAIVLGQWTLSNTVNNDLFTISNLSALNPEPTFNALQSAHVTSTELFNAVNFTGILTTLKKPEYAGDRIIFYDTILPAVTGYGSGDQTKKENFLRAVDLATIYAAATNTVGIQNAFAVAAANAGISVTDLVGANGREASVTAWMAVDSLGTAAKRAFFEDIDFGILVTALKTDPNKDQIYSAINFGQIFNSLDTPGLTSILANVYRGINGLSPGCKSELKGAISIVDMLKAVSRVGQLQVTLEAGGLTTAYDVIFP